MPKAAVDEDGDAFPGKKKIRGSGQGANVHLPTTEPSTDEGRSNLPFSRAVPLESNGAHPPAPLLPRQDIHALDLGCQYTHRFSGRAQPC